MHPSHLSKRPQATGRRHRGLRHRPRRHQAPGVVVAPFAPSAASPQHPEGGSRAGLWHRLGQGARALARKAHHRVGGAGDVGMATAEYAIATLAACGFAGLLVVLLRSGYVRSLLAGIIAQALAVR